MKSLHATGVAFVLLMTAGAVYAARNVILHPNGFGEHSYASWKADEGLPDSSGAKDQALYFQKMTSTATFAAGVAVFKGIEGLPANELTGLSFYWRTDGHCGAGAPRFNIRVRLGSVSQTIFIGCAGMVPGETLEHEGRTYQKRSIAAPAGMMGTITSLSIVFDEGDDVGPGFVDLDNIEVEVNGAPHVWTSASDNGEE